jgi:hypothetical protein
MKKIISILLVLAMVFSLSLTAGATNFNTSDALRILQYSAGLLEFTAGQIQLYDINNDGVVNTQDAIIILNTIANSPPGSATVNIGGKTFSTALTELRQRDLWDVVETVIKTNADIIPLQYMKNLKFLDLTAARDITDLSPLANLHNLETLILSSRELTDLSPLANLHNLETLSLMFCSVSDLTPLANLHNLKTLNLAQNNVEDLSPLATHYKLEDLTLMGNNVTDLSPLVNLKNLETLNLSGNSSISDLSPLTNLRSLDTLNIENTFIYDWTPIMHVANVLGVPGLTIHEAQSHRNITVSLSSISTSTTSTSMAPTARAFFNVTNNTNRSLRVVIPAGTYFASNDSRIQGVITTSRATATVASNATITFAPVSVAFTNFGRDLPSGGSLVLSSTGVSERLMNLIDEFNAGFTSVPYPVKQAAVWIVTDNPSDNDILNALVTTMHDGTTSQTISRDNLDEAKRIVALADSR